MSHKYCLLELTIDRIVRYIKCDILGKEDAFDGGAVGDRGVDKVHR